jgi:hypothetical protein
MTLEPRTRPLTDAERRLLRCKVRRYRRRPGGLKRSVGVAAVGLTGVLWAVTMLASDLSWLVVTAVWLALGVLLYLWVLRDLQKELGPLPGMVAALESALERNEAESYDVQAVGYAAFEEVEDEGACYAFDLGDGRVVFLVGQQFYPSARFPSLDFSVVHPLDQHGGAADLWIEKRDDAAPPDRVIPAQVKRELFAHGYPEPLDVVAGDLEGLEESLRRRGS